MIPPHGLREIRKFYGDVRIEKRNGAWTIIDPIGWEATSMTMMHNLPGLPGRKLYVNKLIERPLRRALENWQIRCPSYQIKSIGCFNPRPKRVSKTTYGVCGWDKGLSGHTIGACVDINPEANPMKSPLTTNMPVEFVQCFTDVGFTHGASFNIPDPMHFQYFSGY